MVELVLLSEKRIGVFKTSVPEDEMGVSESRVSVAMPLRKNESPRKVRFWEGSVWKKKEVLRGCELVGVVKKVVMVSIIVIMKVDGFIVVVVYGG